MKRQCERCGTLLSRFNPRELCNQCHRPPNTVDARRPFWHLQAACRGRDLETFAPEDDGSAANAASDPVMVAKVMCAGCPVRELCLEWALVREAEVEAQAQKAGDDPDEYDDDEAGVGGAGLRSCVFGGFTGAERLKLSALPHPVERGMAAFDRQMADNPAMRLAGLVREGSLRVPA